MDVFDSIKLRSFEPHHSFKVYSYGKFVYAVSCIVICKGFLSRNCGGYYIQGDNVNVNCLLLESSERSSSSRAFVVFNADLIMDTIGESFTPQKVVDDASRDLSQHKQWSRIFFVNDDYFNENSNLVFVNMQ